MEPTIAWSQSWSNRPLGRRLEFRRRSSRWSKPSRKRLPTVVASLGVGDVLAEFPEAAICLTTYSDVSVSQRALVDWFFG